jgi:hypothetical protein
VNSRRVFFILFLVLVTRAVTVTVSTAVIVLITRVIFIVTAVLLLVLIIIFAPLCFVLLVGTGRKILHGSRAVQWLGRLGRILSHNRFIGRHRGEGGVGRGNRGRGRISRCCSCCCCCRDWWLLLWN